MPLTNSLLELRQRGLGVLVLRNLEAGEARGGALRGVARDLHLTGEREHVRKQARLRQCRGIEFFGLGVGGGLVDDGRQVAETARENRDRDIEKRHSHDIPPVIEQVATVARIAPPSQSFGVAQRVTHVDAAIMMDGNPGRDAG